MSLTEIKLDTGQIINRTETSSELIESDATTLANTISTLDQWKLDISALDKDMPRYLEDHIKNEHGGICSDPYQQTAYNNKIALRLAKPI